MSKLKITPGAATVHKGQTRNGGTDEFDTWHYIKVGNVNGVVDVNDLDDEAEEDANAAFVAEAFNVANETGKTPRELMEQRDAAVAMLSQLVRHCTESHLCYPNCIDEANAFLASLTSPK